MLQCHECCNFVGGNNEFHDQKHVKSVTLPTLYPNVAQNYNEILIAAIHSQLVKDLVIWENLNNIKSYVGSFILLTYFLYVQNHYLSQE